MLAGVCSFAASGWPEIAYPCSVAVRNQPHIASVLHARNWFHWDIEADVNLSASFSNKRVVVLNQISYVPTHCLKN